MNPVSCILLALIAAFAYWLLYQRGYLHNPPLLIGVGAAIAVAFILRLVNLDYETLDYTNFLSVWVQYFRDNGGFMALSNSIGNYNVPYLYFLALFSYLPLPDLHLIKLLSIFFDVVLAWYAMELVGLFTKSTPRKLITFLLVLFLPTVYLNGAYWGQCDSIYVAFAVMSVYYALSGRPTLSMVAIALSFAVKLQAVFLFPIYLIFLFCGKLKLRHFLVFPLTYLIVVLPVVLLGRPLLDTLMIYVNQSSTVGSGLNYNSPSIFTLIPQTANPELMSKLGIIAAFGVVFSIYLLTAYRGKKIANGRLLMLATFFAVAVPLLLPHMHERYFFMADIFALCYGMARFSRLPLIPLTQFASLLGYHAYLQNRFLLPMRYGTFALLIVMGFLLFDLAAKQKGRQR